LAPADQSSCHRTVADFIEPFKVAEDVTGDNHYVHLVFVQIPRDLFQTRGDVGLALDSIQTVVEMPV